ncbi:NTF2-related export protein [Aphelenchoides avenae]|nr:NTF2-related export protein [Aphelenchus avenae]
MKFVKLYVDSADIRREKMHVLYSTAEPSLIWNGNNVDGLQNIQSFWSNLPATEHELRSVDAHPLSISGDEKAIVSQVVGTVAVGGVTHAYTQTLILLNEDGNYRVKSDRIRFID